MQSTQSGISPLHSCWNAVRDVRLRGPSHWEQWWSGTMARTPAAATAWMGLPQPAVSMALVFSHHRGVS
ncbi:hypothetical protein CG747_42075 [Streptomyces sp. CB02959]|nr:hypothetical protein CG747_42075 [Streptomyces sp. CB02959]